MNMALKSTAVVAAATALPATAKASSDDPIFAAIAAYRDADTAHTKACHEYSEAEAWFDDEFGHMVPSALTKEITEKLTTEIDPDFRLNPLSSHEQIDQLSGFPPDTVAAMHRELDRQTAIHDERVKPSEEAQGQACDASGAAIREMLNTVPTTPAGLMALLEAVRDDQRLAEFLAINEPMEELLGTVAKFVDNRPAA
jgi:hypothetical protein